jgi:hypothetical protein
MGHITGSIPVGRITPHPEPRKRSSGYLQGYQPFTYWRITMPFIINHIDTFMAIVSVTLKVLKFAATVAHYIALAVGAVLVLTGYWLVTVHQHFTGITQTIVDVADAVHGPVLVEYGVALTVAPEFYIPVAPAAYSLNQRNDWVLEDLAVAIALTKPSRKARGVKPVPVAA